MRANTLFGAIALALGTAVPAAAQAPQLETLRVTRAADEEWNTALVQAARIAAIRVNGAVE